MQIQDVQHLASLARITISSEEAEALLGDLTAIIAYVDQVTEVQIEGADILVSSHRNVFREDVVTTETGEYTEALLKEAPATEGGYIKVQKIL